MEEEETEQGWQVVQCLRASMLQTPASSLKMKTMVESMIFPASGQPPLAQLSALGPYYFTDLLDPFQDPSGLVLCSVYQ